MKNVTSRVLDYIAKNPNAKPQQVAKACKVSPTYVYTIMSKARKAGRLATEIQLSAQTVARGIRRIVDTHTKDNINHPEHYKTGGIETIDFIEAKQLGYHLGNVIKYITRADHKGNRLEDLKKAQWYLNRAVSNLEK